MMAVRRVSRSDSRSSCVVDALVGTRHPFSSNKNFVPGWDVVVIMACCY